MAEDIGDYETAAHRYAAAGSQVEQSYEPGPTMKLAVSFRQCGDFEAALAAAELASEAVRGADDYYLEGQINLTVANILADQQRWSEAIERSRQARHIFESLSASIEAQYGLIGGLGAWQPLATMPEH